MLRYLASMLLSASPGAAYGLRSAIICRHSTFNEGKDTDTWGISDRLAGSMLVVEVGDHCA